MHRGVSPLLQAVAQKLCDANCVEGCSGGQVLGSHCETCTCPDGQAYCDQTCQPISRDCCDPHAFCHDPVTLAATCCLDNEICTNEGQCVACPEGQTACGQNQDNVLVGWGTCVDLDNDPNKCGTCFNACGGSVNCANGTCADVCLHCVAGVASGSCASHGLSGLPLSSLACLCVQSAEGTCVCVEPAECPGNTGPVLYPYCSSSDDCPSGWRCIPSPRSCGSLCHPACNCEVNAQTDGVCWESGT
jgi:hypothetical protein